MVNRGRSGGCKTCKQRRVKCDEAKPRCHECLRVGYECQGYEQRPFRIRYQVPNDVADGNGRQDIRMRAQKEPAMNHQLSDQRCVKLSSQLSTSDDEKSKAISLFITHIVVLGRSLESTRGVLELLTPALALEADNSPLSLALHAAAMQLWCLLNRRSFYSSDMVLFQAYARLRTAIQNPFQRSCGSTVLAAILLQRYERFSAVWNHHEQCHVHRNGALALLRQQKLDGIDSKHRGHLISQLFHTEVHISISKKTSFEASELVWLRDQDVSIMPSNPSTALDILGAAIANHQNKFCLLSSEESLTSVSVPNMLQWYQDIQDTEDQLNKWPNNLPSYWFPQTVQSGKDVDESIITYAGCCDIYPNVQIASIWNVWRTYRLLLIQIKLALLEISPALFELRNAGHPSGSTCRDTSAPLIRDLIDSICRSVSFHLGNHAQATSLSDLVDPTISFPSYHDIHPSHASYSFYKKSSLFMSKDDHRRHVIIQGPWHILGCLSHVLCILADQKAPLPIDSFRPGQMDWMRGQFLRVLRMLRLDEECFSVKNSDRSRTDFGDLDDASRAIADRMAKRVMAALAG